MADGKRRPKGHNWSGIVIHHTSIGNRDPEKVSDELWDRLFKNIGHWLKNDKDDVYVSAHYLIGRNGKEEMLVNPQTHIAYHAGKSAWWDMRGRYWRKSCNGYMIGIELLGDGNKGPFTAEQYATLARRCDKLCNLYGINPNMIVGHEMISPGRKNDPGRYFNWRYFFGLMSKF